MKAILFSGPMVRAILEGRKTMTRRVLKPQPVAVSGRGRRIYADADFKKSWNDSDDDLKFHVGDTLWVREAWRVNAALDEFAPRDLLNGIDVSYEADGSGAYSGRLRPSMFMPRWASRITLNVTGVKVERLQDISTEDASKEGCLANDIHLTPRLLFADLWQSINGPGSWEANPWVAAYSFERVLQKGTTSE